MSIMGNDDLQPQTTGDTPDTPSNSPSSATPTDTPALQATIEPTVETNVASVSDSTISAPSSSTDSAIDEVAADEIKASDKDFVVDVKDGSKKKKSIIIAGVVVTLFAFFASYWFVIRDNNEPIVETNQNQVLPLGMALTLVEGKVEYSDNKGTLWQIASPESEISEGIWLRTSDEDTSRAIVTFDDGSAIRLNKNTQVSLDTSNTENIGGEIVKGEAYARVASSDTRTFELSTKRITAQALGTAFVVGLEDKVDYIEVYQSKVTEKTSEKEVAEGKRLKYNTSDDSSVISDLDIEEVKKDEFILWNLEQDEESQEFKDKLGFLSDTKPPDLNITSPVNGAKIEIPVGSSTTSVDISGTTEAGANVKVSATDGTAQEVTADETGAFKVTVSRKAGDVTYTVTTKDKVGNKSTLSVAVKFVQAIDDTDVSNITLGAVAQPSTGVVVNWSFKDGFSAPNGVKVLWNKTGNLKFPVESAYISNSYFIASLANHRKKSNIKLAVEPGCSDGIYGSKFVEAGTSATICLLDGDSYAFRVCRYDSATSKCDVYSNEVRINAPGGSD